MRITQKLNGKVGIRTLDDLTATPIFKIGAFNHSATFPKNYFNIFYLFNQGPTAKKHIFEYGVLVTPLAKIINL